jgi:adenosylmethionine-8-amino-7-oxononanoate aminotransferase
MKTALPAIGIARGDGACIFDEAEKQYIDAIASWWTNIHGHAHPYLTDAIRRQSATLEHLIFAGFTHEPAVKLAEKLLQILPQNQERVFYSDNGSTAVEVALKMTFQYWQNHGTPRTKVIALRDAYHGDTFGAMSVSGRSAFTQVFESLLFSTEYVEAPVPGNEQKSSDELMEILNREKDHIAAFIYEPLVQGTAGMRVMAPAALDRLIALCKQQGILCIADEVMTGFGRTGRMFASEYLQEKPDLVCLSKGLTGGMMALGVTTSSAKIYDAFLSENKMKTFFHGHSYTANPIACAAGIASLELFEKESSLGKVERIAFLNKTFADSIRSHRSVSEVRYLGVIMAIELKTGEGSSYFHAIRDEAYDYFLSKGILMRPLGNVIYIMPPYCIKEKELQYIYHTITEFLETKC